MDSPEFLTAVSTVVLAVLTGILAWFTKRLSEATNAPQVVASLEVNRWSFLYMDLCVANTGNASAFDVRVEFEPALPSHRSGNAQADTPLRKISVLRPDHCIRHAQCKFSNLIECDEFEVQISWRRAPTSKRRETLKYTIDPKEIRGLSNLGGQSPEVQVAEHLKGMREDLRRFVRLDRLNVNVFDKSDRAKEFADFEAEMQSESNDDKPSK